MTSKNEQSDVGRLKILVLGEAGVGKSTFTQSLKASQPTTTTSNWTIGCSIEIIPHNYRAGTPQQALYLVELWDIGGSRSHSNSRSVFYNQADGAILMHDLSNRKSEHNLHCWAAELFDYSVGIGANMSSPTRRLPFTTTDTPLMTNEKSMPTLIVGSKLDLAPDRLKSSDATTRSSLSLDCRRPIASGSTNRLLLTRFFDSIIERQTPIEQQQRRRRQLL